MACSLCSHSQIGQQKMKWPTTDEDLQFEEGHIEFDLEYDYVL